MLVIISVDDSESESDSKKQDGELSASRGAPALLLALV
jgi:hypothetical protein